MINRQGKWAVVTGASSGIGREMAQILAAKGMNVVLVARREERLKELVRDLERQYRVKGYPMALDLSRPDSPGLLRERLKLAGIRPEVLINNAGFGIKGDFVQVGWERQREMLDLNLMNLTHLTHLFLQDMVAHGSGYVLLVSSIGAYQPTPGYATYAAAKSYVLNFGEALNWELRKSGVSVTVLSPGGTRTEFFEVAGQKDVALVGAMTMSSRRVAELGIRGMFARKSNVLPGWRNWLMAFSTRFAPRRLLAMIADWLMRTSEETGAVTGGAAPGAKPGLSLKSGNTPKHAGQESVVDRNADSSVAAIRSRPSRLA